jgi:hypothetical protein
MNNRGIPKLLCKYIPGGVKCVCGDQRKDGGSNVHEGKTKNSVYVDQPDGQFYYMIEFIHKIISALQCFGPHRSDIRRVF